jgi:uroporphyrinogen decarboxylase
LPKRITSRQRVLAAFRHEVPDRVPINYSANEGIDQRLKAHFGVAKGDDETLLRALGVDFRCIGAPHTGPKLHADVPGRSIDLWGIHRRWVQHATGGYWDYCDWPLREATLDEVERWPMPSPDHFDYAAVAEQCRRQDGYCLCVGNPGLGDVINSTGMIRTMEQVLLDLVTDNAAGLRLIDRRLDIQLEVARRTIEAAQGKADLLWLGEDLGSQRGPLISPALFRRHIRPRMQRFVDLGKAYGLPVMIHSCGSSSWAFDDFLEMGISVADTLQPEANDMAPTYLKKRWGKRLAFHGMISTAGPVAYGTVKDVVRNVRETLETMMPGGGYALAPTHMLQDNSPTENVVAMYEAAKKYGAY